MKKALSFLLCLVMILTAAAAIPTVRAEALTSGNWEYTVSGSKATITDYTGSASTVTIPSTLGGYTVSVIGEMAFWNNSTITSVKIPSSVKTIEYSAFEDCENLKTVTFNSGLETIGDYAFHNCGLLTGITFPSSLLSIGEEAFTYTGLTSVTIPQNLNSLGDNPFGNCTSLTSFSVNSSNRYFTAKSGVLFSNDGTRLIAYPQGKSATSYSVPSGTTIIGCEAFMGAWNLKTITLPSSVSTIEGFAFSECVDLTGITLPSGLTKIGGYAFSSCYNLTSLSIPASVTSIGHGLSANSNIKSFSVASGNTVYSSSDGVIYNKAKTKLISYPSAKSSASFTAASTVTATADYAFTDCTHLTSISLPGLKTMGEGTFSGCTDLKSFTIPSGVTKLADGAFEYCSSLKSITIPSTVTSVGGWAFFLCESLTSATVPASVTTIGESAFADCSPSLVIKCTTNSAAHKYAKAEGINYQLTDITKPTITTQPSSATSAAGNTVTFKVVASGAELSYKWQYSTNNGSTWNNSTMTGYNTASMSVPVTSARNGYLYRCIVTNSAGSVTSSSAKLTVSGVKPAIVVQPSSVTTASGNTATFKVVASGTGLKYQWQWRPGSSGTWQNSSSATTGYNTATLKVSATAARYGYQYRCIVSNSYGSTTSSVATLTVSGLGPVITTQPSSVTTASGNTATFKVVASGTGLKYQWQWRPGSSGTWQNSSSATTGYNTATLKVTATAARYGYQYRCIVTNSYGSKTSSTATLTVTGLEPVITTQPSSVTTTAGNTATFKVVASGTGLKYQWQWRPGSSGTWQNSTSATTGYNTATLKVSATAARNGYQYRCIVTNSYGSTTSSSAKLTVN